MSSSMTLGEAFDIPEVVSASDYVLQLNSGVQRARETVDEYVVTESLATAFDESLKFLESALAQGSSKGVFIHGSFGSGKSHFMAVLDLILRGMPEAKGLPGLQATVQRHQELLGKRFLTVEYHLLGARSFEEALYRGYLDTITREHPGSVLPVLHNSDGLLDSARSIMDLNRGQFFDVLNGAAGGGGAAGAGAAGSGWGDFAGGWDLASFDAAAALPVGNSERERLVADLVATHFSHIKNSGDWLPPAEGLGVMSRHAKLLGYDALVLFLDELVLWLAAHLSDQVFVATEGSKVATLVEQGGSGRDLPIVSFVARQRELRDFLGDRVAGITGAEKLAVGDTFKFWEERFDRVDLAAADLPKIAHKRLLQPRSPAAAAAIRDALAAVKANRAVWDTLLTSEAGAGEEQFAEVYPFSPALVDTLVVLSGLLQRERTALKVMAQLLVNGRDTLVIDDIIPAGDLYDVMVANAETALTVEMQHRFEVARTLYTEKLRPLLLDAHGLDDSQLSGLDRNSAFARDDRLAKTLLVAAIAPSVKALANLTGGKLAALNHGTVRSRIPGGESATVLAKVRSWAETVGEIDIGEGNDPIISVQLSGVDYDSILERVANEDTEAARRTLLRDMLFSQLGVTEEQALIGSARIDTMWRGSKRTIDVVYGNIRNRDEMTDSVLRAEGERWRLIVDFPFDSDGHGPQDDISRIDTLRHEGLQSRTVAWVPSFLTTVRLDDLGKLVRLNYLIRGDGQRLAEHSAHLPPEQRPMAKSHLESLRGALTNKMTEVLKQAYGVAKRESVDIDMTYGDVPPFATLDPDFVPQRAIGADLGQAMTNLADQMLSSQYPDHPRFEPGSTEVRRADVADLLGFVAQAVERGGRVDAVDSAKRGVLRRVANPLKCGQMHENHFVFGSQSFPWRNDFVRWSARDNITGQVPVRRIREWLAPWGLSAQLQDLLILSWSLVDDKTFTAHGAAVDVTGPGQLRDEYVLGDPVLPSAESWSIAVARAATVFGVTGSTVLTAGAVRRLAAAVRDKALAWQSDAADVVKQLESHSETLRLDGSARLRDAVSGRDLVSKLVNEHDDLVVVEALANAALPAEPQPIAKSLSSARVVAASLKGAAWQVLDGVAELVASDREAAAIFDGLWSAAAASELHVTLEPALRSAGAACSRLLTEQFKKGREEEDARRRAEEAEQRRIQAAREEQERQDEARRAEDEHRRLEEQARLERERASSDARHDLDAIELDDVDAALARVADAVKTGLKSAPGKKLRVQWWLE